MKPFNKKIFYFLLPALSGLLLFLAYPPQNLGFLVFVALIPLFYFLHLEAISCKKSFWGGLILGIIFLGGLFGWLFRTFPFDWLGITTGREVVFLWILLIVLWTIQIFFLSLFFAFLAWAYKKLVNFRFSAMAIFVLVPSLWIIIEYLRACGFGVLWLGRETLLGPHWTFGNLTYSLYNYPVFTQIADIAGIYGISFLIVLVNVLLFTIIRNYKKLSQIIIPILILVLVTAFWLGYGNHKLKTEETGTIRKVAVLQTNFLSGVEPNPYQKKEVFDAILKLFNSPQAIQEKPDFIISPEGFGIISITKDKDLVKYLIKDFWQPGQIFLENEKATDEKGNSKSRLFYYALEKEAPLATHDKMLLVPNGDYFPYITKFFLGIYSFNSGFEKRLFRKGTENETGQTPKGIIGGGICSNIVSPNLNRDQTRKGAQFLVSVSSDAPFHGSKSLLFQNLAMSKLRAIENRRYITQATNMGYSFLLNPIGKIVVKSPVFGNKILFSDIKLLDKKTIYVKFGDWPVLLAFLILFTVIFKKLLLKKVIHSS